jgi:hypothetical protein
MNKNERRDDRHDNIYVERKAHAIKEMQALLFA